MLLSLLADDDALELQLAGDGARPCRPTLRLDQILHPIRATRTVLVIETEFVIAANVELAQRLPVRFMLVELLDLDRDAVVLHVDYCFGITAAKQCRRQVDGMGDLIE